MKYTTHIDPKRDEEIVIYAHEYNDTVKKIEQLASEASNELIGFENKNSFRIIIPSDVDCFIVEGNKVYALMGTSRLALKQRLYAIDEMLDGGFVKINQSCIANIKKIDRFEVSFSGALSVIFKNGHKDYVSRRQLKKVKERIGF